MAKRCSKGNEKWDVKISTGKEKKTPKTSKNAAKRKVVIRRRDSCTEKRQSEQWYEEICNFIAESKKSVDLEAQRTTERVKQWQQNTCAQFDVLKEYIVQMHNLQNSTSDEPKLDIQLEKCSIERSVEQRITEKPIEQVRQPTVQQKTKEATAQISEQTQPQVKLSPTVNFLSMPDIDSDVDSHNCFVKPLPPLPKLKRDKLTPNKVERRRSTICGTSKIVPDFPMRRKSQLMHSSVLAISKDPSKFIDNSEAFVSSTVKDHVKRIEMKPIQTNANQNAPFTGKCDLIRQFMETRSRMLEDIVSSSHGSNSNEDVRMDLSSAYPSPTI